MLRVRYTSPRRIHSNETQQETAVDNTAQQAFDDIVAHIRDQGGAASGWYAGITSDLDGRVHDDHLVPREDSSCIKRTCKTSDAARAVEKALLECGCDGGAGGGGPSSIHVYAYIKTDATNP